MSPLEWIGWGMLALVALWVVGSVLSIITYVVMCWLDRR